MDEVTKIAYGGGGGVANPENVAYVLYGWPLMEKSRCATHFEHNGHMALRARI